jgi:hypothetical protein
MISRLLYALVAAIAGTLRWRVTDPSGQLASASPQPIILAFWHNRIFLMPWFYRRRWRGDRAVAAMVSASKDGAKLAEVLQRYGTECVHGSSSRRGKEALRQITRLVLKGSDAVITPDGPRGPRYIVQHGVISLAQLTGAPIVPASYILSGKITLNSWDRFMIPLPFARCEIRLGAPITVPRDADESLREHKRLELQSVLQSLSEP